MNIHDKDFDRINQELIDRYVDRLKNEDHLLDDNHLSFFKIGCSASSCPEWYGRNKYSTIYRRDVLFYSKNDVKMSKIERMNLLNFNIIDMKFEKMIIEHVSIMNGMFKNTEFFRFCLNGRPGFYDGENEYHEYRNVVLNCRFINCVFMNSYAEHTDWINCEFINCTFVNSEFCCAGSEYQNCKFENNKTLNIRV
jgi:hypothetical protein